jgi:hypothetical protein
MSKSDLIGCINESVFVSNGVVHHCRVQWAACEPKWGGRGRHYLMAVEVLPEHDEPKTVHLMFRASTPRNALVKLLNDAVETSSRGDVAHGS